MESSKRVIRAMDMVQTALTEGQPNDVEFTGDLLARTAYDYAGHTGHYERLSFEMEFHHRFAEQITIINRILTALHTGQALASHNCWPITSASADLKNRG